MPPTRASRRAEGDVHRLEGGPVGVVAHLLRRPRTSTPRWFRRASLVAPSDVIFPGRKGAATRRAPGRRARRREFDRSPRPRFASWSSARIPPARRPGDGTFVRAGGCRRDAEGRVAQLEAHPASGRARAYRRSQVRRRSGAWQRVLAARDAGTLDLPPPLRALEPLAEGGRRVRQRRRDLQQVPVQLSTGAPGVLDAGRRPAGQRPRGPERPRRGVRGLGRLAKHLLRNAGVDRRQGGRPLGTRVRIVAGYHPNKPGVGPPFLNRAATRSARSTPPGLVSANPPFPAVAGAPARRGQHAGACPRPPGPRV